MIGKIIKIITPFYDYKLSKMSTKSRPGLIIAKYDNTDDDYVVLPISKISDKNRIHPKYDLKIDPAVFIKSNLKCLSYVRCHKQTTISRHQLGGVICDFSNDYPDKFLEIMDLVIDFDDYKANNALENLIL